MDIVLLVATTASVILIVLSDTVNVSVDSVIISNAVVVIVNDCRYRCFKLVLSMIVVPFNVIDPDITLPVKSAAVVGVVSIVQNSVPLFTLLINCNVTD